VRKTTRELLAFRYAIENSDNTIVITDIDRKIEYVNELFEIKTGYTKEEAYGRNPNIIKSDLVPESVYINLNKTLDSGKKWQGELINRAKDGSLLYEKTSIVPIFMDGELVKYLAIKLDITEYIKQQKILKQSAVVYKTIGDGIVITDKNKNVLSVNPAFIEIFGYSEDEIFSTGPSIVSTLDEESIFYQKLWSQLMEHDKWSGKLHNKTKSGDIIPTWLTVSVIRDENNEVQNFIAIYTNLTDIIKMEEKAEYLAYHDSLTGLPNRAQFERQITDVLDLAKINHAQVAVLFIDLDRFKVINDTLGHHIGDGMLVELSVRIKDLLSKDDMLARIGGDEFVIIVNNVQNRADISKLANDILLLTREPIRVQDYNLYTTVSIGIAFYPDDGIEKSEIIKHADSAMYYAKDSGKDNYQFYTKQLSLDVESRLNMEQELLLALERKELTVYYQPQYYLKNGKISGAEALLRWKNKNIGWISPDEFISVAEETGIIVNIGYYVFEEACREYMYWREIGLEVDSISINISSTQFREDDMLEHLKNIIFETKIPPSSIEIEITERFIMEYSTTNLTILEDLRNIGCRISIDDFGTGYSSLSYMKSLSLDTIKIDKSFISDIPHNINDIEVSKAIIALSKSLGYQVIAEGIETQEQELFLKNHNCDIGQGYYFAKPMEADKFISFVKEKSKKNLDII
jgi:diguanylate cyclase (GGDEF)-like protein/PAS domain S-box-containing protein